MDGVSGLTTAVFVATVLAVAALFAWAAFRTYAGDVGSGTARGRATAIVAGAFVVTLIIPAALALAGVLDRWTMPAPALLLVGAIALATVVLALSPFGARLAATLPLAALVGYQAFRIPVEWVLHRLWREGAIPVEMTWSGRNFDVATGILAAVLALLIARGRAPRGVILAWNVLGLLLLANIVSIAIMATPPFARFDGPANVLPGTFPFVWLPTLLVQAALFGHVLIFRALATRRRDPAPG